MPKNDLISREDAIQAVRHAWAKGLEPSQYIEIIPAVDAEPVRRGRWEKLSAKEWPWEYRCTACGEPEDGHTLYCPTCGAKMSMEDNDMPTNDSKGAEIVAYTDDEPPRKRACIN